MYNKVIKDIFMLEQHKICYVICENVASFIILSQIVSINFMTTFKFNNCEMFSCCIIILQQQVKMNEKEKYKIIYFSVHRGEGDLEPVLLLIIFISLTIILPYQLSIVVR